MKKLILNKSVLQKYEKVTLGFADGESCEIAVADVLELYCEATPIEGMANEFKTSDGFIRIAGRAAKSERGAILNADETVETFDITSLSVKGKRRREINVWVVYDALKTKAFGGDLEEFPPMEVDEVGDRMIAFGERSKQLKRQDNQYHALIEGWKETFGKYTAKLLRVKAKKIALVSGEQTVFTFQFEIRNPDCKIKTAEFVFTDCKHFEVEMAFPEGGSGEIVMSQMPDQRIHVALDGIGIEFHCAAVWERKYYCKQNQIDEA